LVLLLFADPLGNVKKLEESFIEQDDFAVFIHHKNSVQCRIRLRFQECRLGAQTLFTLPALSDVRTHDQEFSSRAVRRDDPGNCQSQLASRASFLEQKI